MRIQYASDFHFELIAKLHHPWKLLTPAANYLVLAGDIGIPGHHSYHNFLKYVSSNWDKVFYVPGNHEYDSNTLSFTERHEQLHDLLSSHRIRMLSFDNPTEKLDQGTAIVGSTLWHPFRSEYKKDIAALESSIKRWEDLGVKICAVSHHLPSMSLISNDYKNHPRNSRFASNCDRLFRSNVSAWIYGHTHEARKSKVFGTIAVCNAFGYPYKQVSNFNPMAYIDL